MRLRTGPKRVSAVAWLVGVACAVGAARASAAGEAVVAACPESVGTRLAVDRAEEVLRASGLETARWRGITVGVGATRLGLRERLAGGLLPAERELVFHPRVGRDEVPQQFGVLLNAVRVLYRREEGEKAKQSVGDALRWIVGNQLEEALWVLAEARSGRGRWMVRARQATAEDPCNAHLEFWFACPPADGEEAPPFMLTSHGPEYDVIARGMAQQRALIERGEFLRRVIEAQRADREPFGADARAAKPITGALRNETAEAALRGVAEACGMRVRCAGGKPGRYTVLSEGARAGDVLLCLARAAGLVLVREGDGYAAVAPRSTAERLWVSLPLNVWALARSTPVERQIQREEAVRALWPLLPAQGQGRIAALPEAARAALARYIEVGFAGAFGMLMEDLPDEQGRGRLALYEDEQSGVFMLAAPGADELIGGVSYLRLKAELTGMKGVVVPMKGDGR